MAKNWICPHCQVAQVLDDEKVDGFSRHIAISDLAEKSVSVVFYGQGCVNPACQKLTASVALQSDFRSSHNGTVKYRLDTNEPPFIRRQLLPEGEAKPQPSYIPQVLVQDYQEACAIRDLSPKAAATLVRRCLQGMIRDFAKIAKPTLDQEIKALRLAVDDASAPRGVTPESVEAINAVRGIGNIGAHMEKDINFIVDVEPGEAQLLIQLVELLFDEWYVARHKREQHLSELQALAAQKQLERTGEKPAELPAPLTAIADQTDDEGRL